MIAVSCPYCQAIRVIAFERNMMKDIENQGYATAICNSCLGKFRIYSGNGSIEVVKYECNRSSSH